MPHETSHLPDGPEGDASSALESAAHHLRASPRPAGSTPAREREILRGRQERDLIAWARESDRLTEPTDYLPRIEDGGEEHRVWLDAIARRYFKVTHAGRFGFTVIPMSDGTAELTNATPLEYLERLLLQNFLFNDAIRLEGVAIERERMVVLSSQPSISGSPVSNGEMLGFMRKLWFQPLQGLSLGRPGSLSFYRDLDEVAAFDAHPGNFVKDDNGVVLPIDLVLVRADAALQTAFAPFLH
jgi:hypothetical protein